jgi:hypothetical protein
VQLKRDVLPALTAADVKLFAVGIGSHGSAREFAEALDFPAELLLADESEDVLAHAAAGTRNTRRDENGKAVFEGVESMWSGKTTAAIEARGRDDLNAITGNLFKPGPYKPLMPKGKGLFDPKAIERTMVQVPPPAELHLAHAGWRVGLRGRGRALRPPRLLLRRPRRPPGGGACRDLALAEIAIGGERELAGRAERGRRNEVCRGESAGTHRRAG